MVYYSDELNSVHLSDLEADADTNLNRLEEIQRDYPHLTFDNNGYEYLSKDIKQSHKDQIKEVSSIIEKNLKGFVRFDNFKPRKDGSIDVRVQFYWSESFVGVGYFPIKEFSLE